VDTIFAMLQKLSWTEGRTARQTLCDYKGMLSLHIASQQWCYANTYHNQSTSAN